MNFYKTLTAFCVFFLIYSVSYAKQWDFQKYPRLDLEFNHLDAEIRITEHGFIEGDVLYNANLKRNGADSLRFHASRMNIIMVSVNDEPKDYRVDDDLLVIQLEEHFPRMASVSVRIQYNTEPGFGIHKNGNGTIWTSQLPKTTRHWIPVFDHPRVEFTANLSITHPAGKTILATGRRGNSGLENVDEETTIFSSNRPVPASALAWAVGDIQLISSTTSAGNTLPVFQRRTEPQIYIYSETERNGQELLGVAADAFQQIQNETGIAFPFNDLHIVILEEDFWETKNYGAGVVFAYDNRENLDQQIQKGILSQWIGALLREEQWEDASAIHLLRANLVNNLFDFDLVTDDSDSPYDGFSGNQLSRWQEFLKTDEMSGFLSDLETVSDLLFTRESKIMDWSALAGLIYLETGHPYFNGFSPPHIESESTENIEYTARIDWEEGAQTAEIYFESLGTPLNELVTVRVSEITFTDTRSHELTFTGESDGSVINVSPGIENLKLYLDHRDDITVYEEKPFLFWIYQLRNDEDPERRAEAARGLARFSDNPDLQLALNDVLQVEANPEIYAEILRSISRITAGASGMEDRFIQSTSSEQNALVQQAAVEALANYPNNERVISRLRTLIIQSNHENIRREAIYSLSEVTEPSRFQSMVSDLVTRESVINEVPLLIRLLAEKGEAESAIDIASTFISPEFPYQIRRDVLDVVLEYDQSPQNWRNRLPELLSDVHPQIRYKAAGALEKLNAQQRREIVTQRIDEEYDERVRRVLR